MQTMPLPARAQCAAHLAEALGSLLSAESTVLQATERLLTAKRQLVKAEDRVLLVDPPILDGRNAETRAGGR